MQPKFKGTPGPWEMSKVSVLNKHNARVFSIDTASGDIEGLAHTYEVFTVEEGVANAKLIAAAPDLLEALRLILPNLKALAEDRFGKVNMKTYTPLLRGQEALEKALGKEAFDA